MASDLLTTAEAARYIRKSPCWLLANRRKAQIPSLKVGGEYRYRSDELDQWLEKQRASDFDSDENRVSKHSYVRKVQLV
jgi:excisionase family DNA binding protein